MTRILFAYFRAGPITHLVLACLFVGLGIAFYTSAMQQERDKAAALAAPMPAAVSLNDFGPGDIHPADEVNVIAQINPAYNYELTQQRKGTDTVRYMYVLFGPDDTADTKVARAAILLEAHELDAFDTLVAANVQTFTDMGPVFSVNGEATTLPDLKSMANDALAKEGLTKAAGFVFIAPWMEGRAVALAPNALDLLATSSIVGSPALLSLLLAAFGFYRRRRQTAAALDMAAGPIPAALMGTPRTMPAAPVLPPAALPPAALRAPMSRGKKIRLGILCAIVLLIVTKQFWVFALLPIVAVLATDRGMRKIAKQAYDMVMAATDKATTPHGPADGPAPQPAPVMPGMTAPPPARPAPKPLPPAIRPGFSFRDLLPRRREPEPQDNPYARLAATIRDEQLRRGGV